MGAELRKSSPRPERAVAKPRNRMPAALRPETLPARSARRGFVVFSLRTVLMEKSCHSRMMLGQFWLSVRTSSLP